MPSSLDPVFGAMARGYRLLEWRLGGPLSVCAPSVKKTVHTFRIHAANINVTLRSPSPGCQPWLPQPSTPTAIPWSPRWSPLFLKKRCVGSLLAVKAAWGRPPLHAHSQFSSRVCASRCCSSPPTRRTTSVMPSARSSARRRGSLMALTI